MASYSRSYLIGLLSIDDAISNGFEMGDFARSSFEQDRDA